MPKRKEIEPQTSHTPMIVLVAGVAVVAALVGWALTRSVEPAPLPPSDTIASTSPFPTSGTTGTSLPSSTAPLTPGAFSVPEHEQSPEKAAVPRISAEDLKAKMARGEVTLIDVRDEGSYEAAHIPGSMHIQMANIQSQLDVIPKGKPIVTYCT
jgi:hypothetical protein